MSTRVYEGMTTVKGHDANTAYYDVFTPSGPYTVIPTNPRNSTGRCNIAGVRGAFDSLAHAQEYIAEITGLRPRATSQLDWTP